METSKCFIVMLIVCYLSSKSLGRSILRNSPENHNSGLISDGMSLRDESLYCDSWRFTVETNNAVNWRQIPNKCYDYVKDYMTYEWYTSDLEAVADEAISYIKSAGFTGEGREAWIFGIDEALLSDLPYYTHHGYGSEIFDEENYDDWLGLGMAPALEASLKVYKEVEKAGVKIFLLSGRDEPERNITVKNLLSVGYSNWEKLILRADYDSGKEASVFKSEKRKEIEEEGYVIYGNYGDQWSDLLGYSSLLVRSFKLPNPMYYIA